MKKYLVSLKYLLVLSLLPFYACEDDKEELITPLLALETSKIEFNSKANSRTVEVESNIRDWDFSLVNAQDANWIKLTKDGGVKMVLSENTVLETRQARIIITARELKEELLVVQGGIAPEFEFAPTKLSYAVAAATKTIEVNTNVNDADWDVTVAEDGSSWCEAKKEDGKIIVTTAEHTGFVNRKTNVIIQSRWFESAKEILIPVTQASVPGSINLPEDGVLRFGKAGRHFVFSVTSPQQLLDLDVTGLPGWVKDVTSEIIKNDDGRTLMVVRGNVEANEAGPRKATLTFRLYENSATAVMTLSQESGFDFEEIKFSGSDFSSNAKETNEGSYENLLDGDMGTFFHTSWSKSIDFPHWLQADLKDDIAPETYFYFYYASRAGNDNNAHSPAQFDLQGSENGNDWFVIKKFDKDADKLPVGAGKEYTSDLLKSGNKFRYIRINVTQSTTGKQFWNMSEFKFFKVKQ